MPTFNLTLMPIMQLCEPLSGEVFSDLIKLNVSVPGTWASYSELTVTNAFQYPALGHAADILIVKGLIILC